MKDVLKVVGNILLYVFAIVVILWTASLSLSLVRRLIPGDDITPYFALALFDGGALVWLIVFIGKAEGLMQRALSLLTMALDLLGVGFMSFAELYLGGQTFVEIPPELGKMVIWAVGGYTILNVVVIYLFHISSPAVAQEIELRTVQDKIFSEGMDQARSRLQANTRQLGDRISNRLTDKVLYGLHLLDPEAEEQMVIDGKLKEPARQDITPKRSGGVFGKLFERKSVSANGHAPGRRSHAVAARPPMKRRYATSSTAKNGVNPTPPPPEKG